MLLSNLRESVDNCVHGCMGITSQFHVVTVSPEIASEAVRTFESYSADLHRMAEWLIGK